MSDFAATAQQLLAQSVTKPDESIILGAVDHQGSMVVTVRTDRTIDLVRVARSLIEDAIQRTQEELAAEDCDSQGDDPVEERLSYLLVALDEINAIDGMTEE